MAKSSAVFGEQRLLRNNSAERLLFRFMGVPDAAHWLHSLYFRRALRRVGSPMSVLDAGCGMGDYSFFIARRTPAASVVSLDIDAARIEKARATATQLGLDRIEFRSADLTQLDAVSRFDFAFAIDVLEHIPDQHAALRRIFASLRPGGFAYFHLPTMRPRPVPFSRHLTGFQEWAKHEHVADERTCDEFVNLVADAGFEVLRAQPTFGYYTGELATSLFALPFENSARNRVLLALIAPVCRVLCWLDTLNLERTRYAVAVLARKRADRDR